MKPNTIIGIDIGLYGAIAFLDVDEGELLAIFDMPHYMTTTSTGREKGKLDLPKLLHILEISKNKFEDATVIMEDINAFPGQGAVAIATLMEQKGIIQGICSALGYEVKLVNPRVWQKSFGLVPPKELKGNSAKKTKALRKQWLKENSRIKAMEEFPEEWSYRFKDNDAHGRSDACLLAKYLSLIL